MITVYLNSNYNKTYSLIDDWEAKRLPYVATIRNPLLPYTLVQWCENNCTGKWSWWFDDDHAYIGFEKRVEVFIFKLVMPLGGSK